MILTLLFAAGLFFAAWPHAMREAGFSSSTALMMYGLVSCVGGLAWMLAAGSLRELHGRSLGYGLAGGALNALGALCFAFVLTRRTRGQLGEDVMILLVIQVALNAAWAAYQTGALSWRLAAGSVTAILTILLLR
jgi:hypothetical protein